ncbi:MAG: acetate--CoA ligase family protein [Pseudomonadota bacterium]
MFETSRMSRDLSRLFRPRSIAVIGGGWGLEVVAQCQKMGFEGEVWPVHPIRDDVHGLPCFKRIEDLPEPPDASFIGINRHATLEAVETLAQMGAGGAVCFASGWAEAEDGRVAGAALQARLVELAGDMPILGPNCYGLINYLDGALLWPDQHGGVRQEGGVAILTQSSNILINMTMAARGLRLAYAIAAGNQAQTGLSEMAMACLDDPRVTAVGLHIEGVDDPRRYEAMAAKARELGKPIVALKVGKSAEAQRATLSHTASLAGSDAVSRAFLNRLGIPILANIPEFLETLKLVDVHGAIGGREIFTVSCSGGEASLSGDAAAMRDLTFRPLTPPQTTAIQETLGPLVTVSNPIDYHTFIWGDQARLEATFTAILACKYDLTAFIFDFPRLDRCSDESWIPAVDAIDAAARTTGAKVAVTSTMAENMPEAWADQLRARRLAPMIGIDETFAATEAAAFVAEAWAAEPPEPVLLGTPEGPSRVVDEAEGKALLATFGVPTPTGAKAKTAAEAGLAAKELAPPLALKGLGIAHKTEAGAVKLHLSPACVEPVASEMVGPEGYLVEEMLTGSVAELILGVVYEPPYGFALTVGSGGVLTELLGDSLTGLVPLTQADIEQAINGRKLSPLLHGYRGAAKADIESIAAAIRALERFVVQHADRLLELDINPLMVTPDRAVAVDALIRLTED